MQFAFGGSYEVDNPDAVVNLLGLTGIPFTDVYNGCATAASALSLAAQTIELGSTTLASPSVWTSTGRGVRGRPGAVQPALAGTERRDSSSRRSSSP